MRFSYNWLQSYFEDPLPDPQKIAEALTMHSFEVEEVEKAGDDFLFSIDVLPNRAHDCFSHFGVAREIGILLNKPLKRSPFKEALPEYPSAERVFIEVDSPELCPRYSAALVSGVKIGPSPEWLRKRLESIGQKSINNVVDVMNYVMLDIGQPLHAFDFEKLTLDGGAVAIKVREARAGEKMLSLDGVERALEEGMLLITDGNSDKPIALAGIKGGADTAIDERTQYVLIEAANFSPANIRKTTKK